MTKATKAATTITVDLNHLRTLLATVAPFAGDDNGLPVIATVYLEGIGGFLGAVMPVSFAPDSAYSPLDLSGWLDGLGVAAEAEPEAVAS